MPPEILMKTTALKKFNGHFKAAGAWLVIFFLLLEQIGFAQAAGPFPLPGYLSGISAPAGKFHPAHIRSLGYEERSRSFSVLVDNGDNKDVPKNQIDDLWEYLKTGLNTPEDKFWVNLRPDSPDSIIDPALETSAIGKILLEADLQLKKELASLTSPETAAGKEYWGKLYAKTEQIYGGEDVEIPTVTRPWIVPGEIILGYDKNAVYIYKAGLKVMLEEDYIRSESGTGYPGKIFSSGGYDGEKFRAVNEYSTQLLKKAIIPELTRRVNTSSKYAALRQVYYSLILAQWVKTRYSDQFHEAFGGSQPGSAASALRPISFSKDGYYKAYLRSFREGEYRKEETVWDKHGAVIRQYVSGGVSFGSSRVSSAAFDIKIIPDDLPGQAVFISNPRDGGRLVPKDLPGIQGSAVLKGFEDEDRFVDLKKFINAVNILTSRSLSVNALSGISVELGIKNIADSEIAYSQVFEKLAAGGLTKKIVDLINEDTFSADNVRLEVDIVDQNSNPRVQGVYEAISNSLDALGFSIGQFGKGVKQLLAWLEPNGSDRIEVLSRPSGGQPYRLIIRKKSSGEYQISINKASLSEFVRHGVSSGLGALTHGTIVNIVMDGVIHGTLQEGIVSGIHKRFPFATEADISTQIGRAAVSPVNGFENKKVIVPAEGFPPADKKGAVRVKITEHTVSIADNGKGMDAQTLARMFVPRSGSKMTPVRSAGGSDDLKKVKVVHDPSLLQRVSFARNGEVVEAIDIPDDVITAAVAQGGLMIDMGLFLEVPESRDNVIIPASSGDLKSGFQLAAEYSISRIISHPGLSQAEKLKYVNTLITGLDGLIQGNPHYSHTVKTVRQYAQKELAKTIDDLESQGYVILPHKSAFLKFAIPQGQNVLYAHEKIIDWKGAPGLAKIGGKTVPVITVGGDKKLPLVVVPFTASAMSNVRVYNKQWYELDEESRLPVVVTDHFTAVPEEFAGRLLELASNRNKGLSAAEKAEFKSIIERIDIITADRVNTSYEVNEKIGNISVDDITVEPVWSSEGFDRERVNLFMRTEKSEGLSGENFHPGLKLSREGVLIDALSGRRADIFVPESGSIPLNVALDLERSGEGEIKDIPKIYIDPGSARPEELFSGLKILSTKRFYFSRAFAESLPYGSVVFRVNGTQATVGVDLDFGKESGQKFFLEVPDDPPRPEKYAVIEAIGEKTSKGQLYALIGARGLYRIVNVDRNGLVSYKYGDRPMTAVIVSPDGKWLFFKLGDISALVDLESDDFYLLSASEMFQDSELYEDQNDSLILGSDLEKFSPDGRYLTVRSRKNNRLYSYSLASGRSFVTDISGLTDVNYEFDRYSANLLYVSGKRGGNVVSKVVSIDERIEFDANNVITESTGTLSFIASPMLRVLYFIDSGKMVSGNELVPGFDIEAVMVHHGAEPFFELTLTDGKTKPPVFIDKNGNRIQPHLFQPATFYEKLVFNESAGSGAVYPGRIFYRAGDPAGKNTLAESSFVNDEYSRPRIYKHPSFDLIIDHRDNNDTFAIDPLSGKRIQYSGDIVQYDRNNQVIISKDDFGQWYYCGIGESQPIARVIGDGVSYKKMLYSMSAPGRYIYIDSVSGEQSELKFVNYWEYRNVDYSGGRFIFESNQDGHFKIFDPAVPDRLLDPGEIGRENTPADEKKGGTGLAWDKDAVPLREQFIKQARASYLPYMALIPEQYRSFVESDLAESSLALLYVDQEHKLREIFNKAVQSGDTAFDPGSAGEDLPFDIFERNMRIIIPILSEYLNKNSVEISQEPIDIQKKHYSRLFGFLFGAATVLSLSNLDDSAITASAWGWYISSDEKLQASKTISRLISGLKDMPGRDNEWSDIKQLIIFLSKFAHENPGSIDIIIKQINKIMDLNPAARYQFLRKLNIGLKSFSPKDYAGYVLDQQKTESLGQMRPFIVFLTNDVEQVREKNLILPEGEDISIPLGGIDLSRIIIAEQRRAKSDSSAPVIDIEDLIKELNDLPPKSAEWEADLLRNVSVQRESGAYAAEITQNAKDATIGLRQGELTVDFYLQSNQFGRREYVEEASDNGTGALYETALLIPKSTKAAGGQVDVTGFFGTGKYTMFEGVDRLQIITRNSSRAYMFSFAVNKDQTGKPVSVKLDGIRRINDKTVSLGVTVRRIKDADNTIPELDQMLAQRSWKIFAGLAQSENFSIYMTDSQGQKKRLSVDYEILSEIEFMPARKNQRDHPVLRIVSARDLPMQIVDRAGLRVSEIKPEYLSLIPETMKRHLKELNVSIQIPLPLIRNRSGFENEPDYLPEIQKNIAIAFYKAIAFKALTQTSPQFSFEGFPFDWETNDHYWDSISPAADRDVAVLSRKINSGAYGEISHKEMSLLLTEKGKLDFSRRSVKLILMLESRVSPEPYPVSLIGRRLAVMRSMNKKIAEQQINLISLSGGVVQNIPDESAVPDIEKKKRQADSIAVAHEQMRDIRKYIVDPSEYTRAEDELVNAAYAIGRNAGISQVILLSNEVVFAGSFQLYKGERTMFLKRGIVHKNRSEFGDSVTETIVHELAHLLEEYVRQANKEKMWRDGYIADISGFTHDSVGPFAQAMKYVAALSFAKDGGFFMSLVPPDAKIMDLSEPGNIRAIAKFLAEGETVALDLRNFIKDEEFGVSKYRRIGVYFNSLGSFLQGEAGALAPASITYPVCEILKNALVHGNSMYIDIPIIIRLDEDVSSGKRSLLVDDFGVAGPLQESNYNLAKKEGLSGYKEGVNNIIEMGWEYDRRRSPGSSGSRAILSWEAGSEQDFLDGGGRSPVINDGGQSQDVDSAVGGIDFRGISGKLYRQSSAGETLRSKTNGPTVVWAGIEEDIMSGQIPVEKIDLLVKEAKIKNSSLDLSRLAEWLAMVLRTEEDLGVSTPRSIREILSLVG